MPSPAPLQGFTEAVTRHVARGWARDPLDPARRVVVRAVAGGVVVGEAVAEMYRGDVHGAGLGDGNCGFVIDLSAGAERLGGVAVTLCDAATGAVLQGSPMVAGDPAGLARFLSRWDGVAKPVLARLRRMMRHRLRGRGVSVVAWGARGVPALLASLRAQLGGAWELLVPDGAEVPAERRVRVLPRGADPLAAARYPVALVVTGAVVLERDALWHLLHAAQDGRAAVFLWDVAREGRGGVVDVLCRPAFSLDLFRSWPDVGGAFAVRRAAAGAWRAPVEMVLSLAEAHPVAQVPRVLHRTAEGVRAPGAAALRAVRGHLARVAQGVSAKRTADGIVTHWPQPAGRTLVVVPTRNQAGLLRRCLESLFRTRQDTPLDIVVVDHESDEAEARAYLRQVGGLVSVLRFEGPFHFARMNNLAVARFGGEAETLLFLNNDTEAMAPGWLGRMRALAARPDVGAVGALLLYGDRRVQHGGVVLGFDGSATHAHAMVRAFRDDGTRVPGYGYALVALREVSAVTAACMMVRRAVFAAAGGFDEALPIGFNDTDLCLRLRAMGYRILQDGQTVLFHHESRTRKLTGQWLHPPDTALFQARWGDAIRAGDPFYSPNLRLEVQDHELRWDCLPGGDARLSWFASPTPPGAGPAAAGIPASAAPRRRRSSG